jgi:hypothetical protein
MQSIRANKAASISLSNRAALLGAAIVRELLKLNEKTLNRRVGDINEFLQFVLPFSEPSRTNNDVCVGLSEK